MSRMAAFRFGDPGFEPLDLRAARALRSRASPRFGVGALLVVPGGCRRRIRPARLGAAWPGREVLAAGVSTSTCAAGLVRMVLVPEELGVGPGIDDRRALADLDDLRREPLDEVPVVRHEDERPAVGRQARRAALPSSPDRGGWSARRAAGCSTGAAASARRRAACVRRPTAPGHACRHRLRKRGNRRGCCGWPGPCWSASPRPASRRRSAPDPSASPRPARSTASRRCGPRSAAPASGVSSPDSRRMSVDLPAPLGPTSATRSPRSMCRLEVAEHHQIAVGLPGLLQLQHRAAALRRRRESGNESSCARAARRSARPSRASLIRLWTCDALVAW